MKPIRKEYRHRSRGAIPLPRNGVEVMTKSGNRSVSSQWSTYGDGQYAEMSDVVTHGFAPGKMVVANPMASTTRSQSGSGVGVMLTQISPPAWSGTTYECDDSFAIRVLTGMGALSGPGFLLPGLETSWSWDDQAAYEVATTKALRVPSKANLLVSIAEYDQAVKMVPGIWSKWASLLGRVKRQAEKDYSAFLRSKTFRGRKPKGVSLLDAVNSTYLMGRFGLRPLVLETHAVLELMQAAVRSDPIRETMRGTAFNTSNQTSNSIAASGVVRTPISRSDTCRTEFRAMRLLEAEFDTARDAGLAINQIPEAAIDLVSYSFVVNWLINVNDFVSSVGEALHSDWTELTSCVVKTRTATSTINITGPSTCTQPTTYQITRHPSGMFLTHSITKVRTIGLPTPSLTVRPQPFKWARDFRLLDAIALVRNAVSSNHSAFMRKF